MRLIFKIGEKKLRRVNFNKLCGAIVLAMLVFSAGMASAQSNANRYLQMSLTGYLVTQAVDDKGLAYEKFGALSDSVLPGYVIQYEIAATNSSKGSASADVLRNVALVGSVPQGTVYIAYSVSNPSLAEFSIDGGKTYSAWPVSYKDKLSNGAEAIKIAGPELCTGIRWIIPEIKPQETIKVRYRVKVGRPQ